MWNRAEMDAQSLDRGDKCDFVTPRVVLCL